MEQHRLELVNAMIFAPLICTLLMSDLALQLPTTQHSGQHLHYPHGVKLGAPASNLAAQLLQQWQAQLPLGYPAAKGLSRLP